MKRKADLGADAPKIEKSVVENHPSKRQKPFKAEKIAGKVDKKTSSKPPKEQSDTTSILQVEEKSFPRGGANVLTPLEHKQISIQATKDVLFEQSKPKGHSGDAPSDLENGSVRSSSPKPRQKRKKNKTGKTFDNGIVGEKLSRIEGLSYKRLVPGTLVLGQVIQITSRDVALALPNNLTGYVSLMEISDQLNNRVEKLLEQADEMDLDTEEQEFDDIDLKKMFSLGQYLRAYVVAAGTESAHSGKKRIDLSLKPRLANTEISKAELTPNIMVQAAVSSVEDHGLIMDLALQDSKVKGFLSTKELGGKKISEIEEGSVFLCLVTGIGSDGRVVKLSIDESKSGNAKKHFLSSSQSVRSFVPGTAVEVLISHVTDNGIRGQIQGMVDVTADIVHSGLIKYVDMKEEYSPGKKIKARVLFSLPRDEGQALGLSLLSHIIRLDTKYDGANGAPTDEIAVSSVIEDARVLKVLPALGLFLELADTDVLGFAHISSLSDKKIEKLSTDSGTFKEGSTHDARVLSFNAMDGHFILSLQKHVIEQPFLRIEDIKPGQLVKGTVEKLHINEHGVNLLVKLADGIVGLVPVIHMADVQLEHPERKFREGLAVKARILSTDPERRRVRLTLKKTLVNSDAAPWTSYEQIQPGAKSPGTLVNILPSGAVVQFYGNVRAFLPVSEMSEAYIADPRQHFKIGQVVNVTVLDVDSETGKMTVSCKNPNMFDPEQLKMFDTLKVGELVKASVGEIALEFITCNVQESLNAILRVQHLSDGSLQKSKSLLKKLRVGQNLNDLVIIGKDEKRQVLIVSQKPSLVRSAQARTLVDSYEHLIPGKEYAGFVRNITEHHIFVEFANGVVGLLPEQFLMDERRHEPNFGLEVGQSLSVKVFSVDKLERKATLTMKEHAVLNKEKSRGAFSENESQSFSLGEKVTAIVTGVRATQLNVELADKVHGRVDASEVFEKWQEIKDRKKPLCGFKVRQEIDVRVIGVHDVKSRRFLPISHRHGPHMVYELSARNMSKDDGRYVLTMDKLLVGDKVVGIVNNHDDGSVWVNLAPSVRGRVKYTDLRLEMEKGKPKDPENTYPIGSAMLLSVTAIDLANNKLDLSMGPKQEATRGWESLTVGEVLSGIVTKVQDRGVHVNIDDHLHGVVPLVEIADNYDLADPHQYEKGSLVKVAIVHVDKSNKTLYLSLRPSLVDSKSSAPVKDRHIRSPAQMKVNDLLRGFVKNVSDKGVFISLGPAVTALVPIGELSDQFVKDWKSLFTVDQLVTGKIISVDPVSGFVNMSLKESLLTKDYIPLLRYQDMKPQQIVSAKVRKVEPFGVFIVVDDSANVSGLCHKSEIADESVEDVTKLYEVGDKVKAIVLKVDLPKKRVNFGLKASYFKDVDDQDTDGSDIDMHEAVEEDEIDHQFDDTREIIEANEVDEVEAVTGQTHRLAIQKEANGTALLAGAFDWTGGLDDNDDVEEEHELISDKKKKRKKPAIQEDKTGDMDKYGPQGNADYERLLLGQPNNANTWILYMAHVQKAGETDKAREIAERGLKTINPLDQDEKKNLWIAYLNLENAYGSDETTDEVFSRACEYNDKDEMHEKFVSILIGSGKHDRAEDLFSRMTHLKSLTATPKFWLNYADFLMTTAQKPDAAHALLMRATQSVDESEHRALTAKFGALEYRSPNGDAERGRTIFEGLLSTYPRRFDLWDMYVDLEKSHGNQSNARKLYERMANSKMKKQRAKFVFKKWLEFEEALSDMDGVEKVKKLAAEYVNKMQE